MPGSCPGYSLLQHLRNTKKLYLRLAPTISLMCNPSLFRIFTSLSSWSMVVLCMSLGLTHLPLAFANPPNGRLNQEERQRLRQEIRQHSPIHQPQTLPNVNPAAQARPVPPAPASGGPGQLSPDDRRALRQQVREQRARESFAPAGSEGPITVPASSNSAQTFKP